MVLLDFLTQVTNVHWGGGAIFIVNGRHYIEITTNTEQPAYEAITWPDSPKGKIHSVLASSYRRIHQTPTFVICGVVVYDEDNGAGAQAGVILTSSDGLEWRQRFMSQTDMDGEEGVFSSPNAVVWNPHDAAFYYEQRVVRPGLEFVETPTGANNWAHEQIYSSSNGTSWSGPIVDSQIWYGAETNGWRSAFPPAHCMHNDCTDTLGQNVPDGFMHEADDTESGGVLIRPKKPITINYGIPSFEYGDSNYSDQVEIVSSGHTVTRTVSGIGTINCVAGANAIWMAGGEFGIKVSFDDGETWESIEIEGVDIGTVLTISAAPPQDFETE